MNESTISSRLKRSQNLYILIECGLMIALGTVLSLVEIPMPFGGGITLLSMVPILLAAYKHGIKWGLATGFTYSILQLILGWKNVGYAMAAGAKGVVVCILFDYIIAFTVLGFAGMFKNSEKFKSLFGEKRSELAAMIAGISIVIALRFLSHFLSGGLVWYELTKVWDAEDLGSMVHRYRTWGYSFVYNIIYMGPELLSSLIVSPFLLRLTKISIRKKTA